MESLWRRLAALIGGLASLALVIAACGGGEEEAPTPTPRIVERTIVATAEPTATPTPTPRPQVIERTIVVQPTPTPAPALGAVTREIKGMRWVAGTLDWRLPLRRGGTHTYGFAVPSVGTDPILSNSFTVSAAVNMVYNQLVRCRPNSELELGDIGECEPAPDLAVSWQVGSNGSTWTFKLNEKAAWQRVPQDARGYDSRLASLYGRPVNANDIVHTVNYWQGKLKKPDGTNQGTPSNTSFADGIAEAKAVDAKTVQFTLKTPDPFLPSTLAEFNARIVPPEIFNLDGDYTKRSVGSGAFILTKWDPRVEWEAIANPNFWRNGNDGKPLPYIDKHVVKVLSPTTARAAMITGQIDSGLTVGVNGPTDAINFSRQCPTCQVVEFFQPNSSFAIGFKIDGPDAPFADRRARLAIAKAMDWPTFIQNVHQGAAIMIPITNPWTVFWDQLPTLQQMGAGLPDDENPYIFNADLAKKLWADSGHKTGEKHTFVYWEYSAVNTNQNTAIAAQLSKVLGIQVEAVKAPNIQVYYTAVGFLGPPHQQFDSLAMLTTNIGTNNSIQPLWMTTGNPRNLPGFANPRIDAIAKEWSQGVSKARERELGLELYKLEVQELRRIAIPNPARYAVYSARLKNVWQQVRGGEMFHQGSGAAEQIWLAS